MSITHSPQKEVHAPLHEQSPEYQAGFRAGMEYQEQVEVSLLEALTHVNTLLTELTHANWMLQVDAPRLDLRQRLKEVHIKAAAAIANATQLDTRDTGPHTPTSDTYLRTWNSGRRCGECCNGDRCDDPTHYTRAHCPHCKGTGWALWTDAGRTDYLEYLRARFGLSPQAVLTTTPKLLSALEQIERLSREADGRLGNVPAMLGDIARAAIQATRADS